MLYIDTSVLVAYYCPEAFSAQAEALLTKQAVTISALTQLEFTSALSQKIRSKTLAPQDAHKILSLFEEHIKASSYGILPFNNTCFSVAHGYIKQGKSPLKTLDSLHLAIACNNKATIVTADKALYQAAKVLKIKGKLIGDKFEDSGVKS